MLSAGTPLRRSFGYRRASTAFLRMSKNARASRLAPPTRAPSTSGCATRSRMFSGLTLPPQMTRPRSAASVSWRPDCYSRHLSSVRRGLLNRVDDEHFDRPARGPELQPELLLERGEQRRAVRVDRRRQLDAGDSWTDRVCSSPRGASCPSVRCDRYQALRRPLQKVGQHRQCRPPPRTLTGFMVIPQEPGPGGPDDAGGGVPALAAAARAAQSTAAGRSCGPSLPSCLARTSSKIGSSFVSLCITS